MKKLLFVFMLFLPLGLWCGYSRPFEKTERLADYIYLDTKDNIYFVSENEKYIEILRTSPDGALTGRWKTNRYNQYDYSRIDDLIFDENGLGFCSLSSIDSRDYTLTAQEWLYLDFDAGKENVIYKREFKSEEKVAHSIGVSLRKSEKGFYSLTYYLNRIILEEFDSNGVLLSSIKIPVNEKNCRSFFTGNGTILFSNVFGEIFSLLPGDNSGKIYKDIPGSFSAFELDIDDNIYLYDYKNKVFKKSRAVDNYSAFEKSSISFDGDVWIGRILSENHYAALDESKQGAFLYKNGVNKYVAVPDYFEWTEFLTVLGIGIIFSFIYLSALYLIKKLRLTVSLLVKQGAIILFVIGGGVFALSFWLKDTFTAVYEEDIIFALRKTVHKFQNLYDPSEFWNIDLSAPEKNPLLIKIIDDYNYYVGETKLFKLLPDGTRESVFISENHYVEIMFLRDEEWRTVYYDDFYINLPMEQIVGTEKAKYYNEMKDSLSHDGLIIGFEKDNENFVGILIPVYDSNGKMAALIEAGISKRQYIHETEETIRFILIYTAGVMLAAVAILLIALGISLHSLKRLRRGVLDAGKGNYRQLVVKGNDEITAISLAFNEMSSQIQNNTNHLKKVNEAYFRFIPLELLQKLGQESVLMINHGDCADIDAYILYLSLINFSEITEKMDSNETFSYYNRICGDITMLVMENNGIVENCNQSEFICIFDKGENALNAAVDINKKHNDFNQYQKIKLKTVSALVKGTALIGVAGNEKRLETITISKCIELSRVIAGIGTRYGVRIIYPENEIHGKFSRVLGTFSYDGEMIRLFDCYAADENDSFFSKKQLSELFEKGVFEFEGGNFEAAKSVFIKYLRESVPCQAVKQYLFLCEHNIIKPEEILTFGELIDL